MKNFDCIDGNMDVLMYDNTIKKVRDLNPGDPVYAISYDGEDYRYIKAEVLSANKRRSKAVRITLSDGRHLICSPCHQWLTQAGWHFSLDDGKVPVKGVFLKDDLVMFGFSKSPTGSFRETKNYMAGYIISIEIYGQNMVPFRSGEMADIVFRRQDITTRVYNYMTYFGIDAQLSDCLAHDRDTNEYFKAKKISITYMDILKLSEKFVRYKDDPEFVRGYVAGVYDADGTINPMIKSIRSVKKDYLNILKSGIDLYDFEYSYNSEFMEVSLIGGPTELIRFYNIFNPVTVSRVENLNVRNRRVGSTKIAKIEPARSDDLYEITTTARNFIAGGIVSHDCAT